MAGSEQRHAAAGTPRSRRSTEDFLGLSQQILLCAKHERPNVEFLVDVSDILVSFSGCRALELWLKNDEACARWEATGSPKRLYRLGNVPFRVLNPLVKLGTVWTNDAKKDHAFADVGEDRSLARFPLEVNRAETGLLLLKSDKPFFFNEQEIQLYQHIARTVAIALDYQKAHLAQRERVKELTCLYDVAQAAAQTHLGLDEILQRVVNRLPSAWQYPEIAAARILVDDHTYSTANFAEGCHWQEADITVEGEKRGQVEVIYLEDKPDLDEGPFLSEERKLIDAISQEIAFIILRKTAEVARITLQEQIRHADRLATIGQLAAGVAHELNEPLGGILGFAQLAMKHPDLPAEVSRDLGKIEAATLHAREVIRKLMMFARQTTPSKKLVDLNQLVEDGLYLLESRCTKSGIQLTRSLRPRLPLITADPTQLHQVLVSSEGEGF